MASEPTDTATPADIDALIRICNTLCRQCVAGRIADIPDEAATALVTTATLLYAAATHDRQREIAPFPDPTSVPATSIVVTTKAMLEHAGLSSFDLAMWSNRVPSKGG